MDKLFLVLLSCFILLVFLGGVTIVLISSKAGACYQDPLNYAIKSINEKANTDMSCTCSFIDNKYASIIVDKNGTRSMFIETAREQDIPKLNISNFIISR